MLKTINAYGLKYRGCHRDCYGCIYQVKAMVGRQHGCYAGWTAEDFSKNCPINHYWTGETLMQKDDEMKNTLLIDGIEFILETEHSSRTSLNKYIAKLSGTIHIKRTTYGTWRTYRIIGATSKTDRIKAETGS